jgi:hypothetical protein
MHILMALVCFRAIPVKIAVQNNFHTPYMGSLKMKILGPKHK